MFAIDRIAAGGDGVGRIEGLAVFVPRSAPGDVVQAAYVTHGRHGRGRVLQVLTASPHRVEAPCVHYERDRCGGCQLQHLDDTAQREARRHLVQETLQRIGHRAVPLPPLLAGESWGYRSRLTVALRRRGSGWIGGLRPHDDPARVFPLEQCLIAHPLLVEVWGSVSAVLRRGPVALPTGGEAERTGDTVAPALRLSLRLESPDTPAGAPAVALVVEGGAQWPEQAAFREAMLAADARVSGVWWTAAPAAAGGTGGRRNTPRLAPAAVAGDEYAPQGREALAFSQVNAEVAGALRDHVFASVIALHPTRVLDGYAGTGQLSERLVAHGISAVAVEADAAGADVAARRLATASPIAPVPDVPSVAQGRVVCDLMERALAALDVPVEVVVLNPPRRGVHPDVTAWLEAPAQRNIRGVVYVSCDPATLARDLARLPSWRVDSVQCFDMFPQTAHVETVCVLRREDR